MHLRAVVQLRGIQCVVEQIDQRMLQSGRDQHRHAGIGVGNLRVHLGFRAQQLEAITARLGPVPVSRIEQIRREIMGIARELEEAGEIQLQLFAEQTAE